MYVKNNYSSLISFIFTCVKPFKGYVFGIMSIVTFWAVNVSLRPYLLKLILEQATKAHTTQDFYYLALWLFLYSMRSNIHSTVFCIYDWIVLRLNAQLRKRIGLLLMERLTEHSASYYQDHFAGNLMNKVENVIKGVPEILLRTADRCFAFTLSFVCAIYMLYYVDTSIAFSLAIWIIVFVSVSLVLSIKTQRLSFIAASAHSQVAGNIVDILTNITNIRLFSGRHFEQNYLEKSMEKGVQAEQTRDGAFALINIFQRISFALFQMVSFWFLYKGLQNKTLTAGDFALVITLNLSILDNLWWFAEDIRRLTQEISNVGEGFNAIMKPVDMEELPNAKTLVVTHGEIVFNNVQFMYKGVSPLFNNKSMIIPAGQKLGLVGYSGSGKSTFVNLILRIFDISQGSITIDGQDIKEVTLESLRNAIAMIPQESCLFHRTVIENIQYSNRQATYDQIVKASMQADAHDFIMKLDNTYDTEVGERGNKLSGGQRQRISIARALLKNAPILMLDEATSHLDAVTEEHIQEKLAQFMKGKTTLVIAHRLSTLLQMDRILVFNKGTIVQDGTHEELLAQDGLYKTLWDTQVGGFLGDDNSAHNK